MKKTVRRRGEKRRDSDGDFEHKTIQLRKGSFLGRVVGADNLIMEWAKQEAPQAP